MKLKKIIATLSSIIIAGSTCGINSISAASKNAPYSVRGYIMEQPVGFNYYNDAVNYCKSKGPGYVVEYWDNKNRTVSNVFVSGDVNYDGKINLCDISTLQQYFSNMRTLTNAQKERADANNDGVVSKADLAILTTPSLFASARSFWALVKVRADANNDGVVSKADLAILSQFYSDNRHALEWLW